MHECYVRGALVALVLSAGACSYNKWTGTKPEHRSALCQSPLSAPVVDTVLAVVTAGLASYFVWQATQRHQGGWLFTHNSNAPNYLFGINGGLLLGGSVAHTFSAAYGYRRAKECGAPSKREVLTPRPKQGDLATLP